MRKVSIFDKAKQIFKSKPAEFTQNSVDSQRSVREVAQQLGRVIDTKKDQRISHIASSTIIWLTINHYQVPFHKYCKI